MTTNFSISIIIYIMADDYSPYILNQTINLSINSLILLMVENTHDKLKIVRQTVSNPNILNVE